MAHSDLELKITPLHLIPIDKNFLFFLLKSEFCPFSKINHDRFKCVYAHNWQDFKRPFNDKIKPVICKNWDKNKEILEYTQGCENGSDCVNCHGWKELEYHVANFKKIPCKALINCDRKDICSFTHGENDIEVVKQNDEFFTPVQKSLDYGHMPTLDYLGLIDVVINTNESACNQFGEGSVTDFRRKKVPGNFGRQEEPEFDLDGKATDKEQSGDPNKQRFSEKQITIKKETSEQNQPSNIYFSVRNINRNTQIAEKPKIGFNKSQPFKYIEDLERSKKDMNNGIQETNQENSSSNEDNDI